MSNIMFFSIPAHGHTNPTIGVVAELVRRGHRVRYYSFDEFQEKIESTGAEFISCDGYLPPAPENLDDKVGKDFASLIEMVVDTTLHMDSRMEADMREFQPDCVLSDSVCFWGKLFAWKYGIPFVCSTTTFAFNCYSSKLMKQNFTEMFRMVLGIPRIGNSMKKLRKAGYEVKDFLSILQNDNDTDTIVYTSKLFQPMAETFSDRYAFVGPSVVNIRPEQKENQRAQIYISLGTVLNDNIRFYRECIKGLADLDCDVVISVGRKTDVEKLGPFPDSFSVYPYVDQVEVLARSDVFLTHCGMNSVNESLYLGVPMILYPQHSEENAVAARVEQLGAGVRLIRADAKHIQKAVKEVLEHPEYRMNAQKIREDFLKCGGSVQASDFIENIMSQSHKD